MEVYYYLPIEEKDSALTCGIKLSVKADRKVIINGYPTSCISTLLNPRDDLKKYKSNDFICLRININIDYCYIADKSLYNNKQAVDLYNQSIIPAKNYTFGTYRNPECLVTCTILPENIQVFNKIIGSPILYHNSEELYINNLIEELKETYPDFNEVILHLFFDYLAKKGEYKKVENNDITVYIAQNGKVFTVKGGFG